MKITIATGLAPWLIASKDQDSKRVLLNLLITRAPAGGQEGLVVASDTWKLVVVRCLLEDMTEPFDDVLIPADWVARVYKGRHETWAGTEIEVDQERRVARAKIKGIGMVEIALAAGQYPNWQRILDGEFNRNSCPAAQDDWHFHSPKQLGEVALALGVQNGHPVPWFQRQPSSALVIFGASAANNPAFAGIGLLMPGNDSLNLGRYDRLRAAEKWLCPKIGEATVERLEKLTAACDAAACDAAASPEEAEALVEADMASQITPAEQEKAAA